MKRPAKIIAILAGVVAVIIVAAAVALYTLIDTDTLKKQVAEIVHEQTGREIAFSGDIGLSFFPWLGVEVGEVSLSNAPGFGNAPFAKLQRASVKVKLVPLLSQNIEVSSVIVDGLNLNLARNKNGTSNWDDLTARTAAPPNDAGQADSQGDSGQQAFQLAGLNVDGVSITNATVNWTDAMQNQQVSVNDFNFTTGPLGLGKPFDFDLSGAVTAATPSVSAALKASATAALGKDFKKPSLSGLKINIDADGDVIPGGNVQATILGDIIVDLNDSTITVESMQLSAMDMQVDAKVKVNSFDTTPVINTTLDIAQFNPRSLMKALDVAPPATSDPSALSSAKLQLTAKATPDAASVNSMRLTLDDTTLTGSASVNNFSRPAIAFNLKADALDVDRYLPPSDKDASTPPPDSSKTNAPGNAGQTNDSTKSGLPKEQLRKLDVNGTLQVGSLKVKNVTATNMNVKLTAKDGLIRITPLSAGLYGGMLRTKLTADLRSKETKTKLDLGLKDMGVGPLLKAVMGDDKVTGLGEAALNLSATGETLPSVLQTLTGNAAVALRQGVFKGFQIIPERVRKQASAQDPTMEKAKQEKRQPFDIIAASFDIKNGIVSTQDTKLSAKGMSGAGAGSVNLAAQTIDYRTVVDITALPKVPFTITGSLTNPDVALDTQAFLKEAASDLIKTPVKIGKEAFGLGEDALKGIGKGLLDVFGGSKEEQK